MIDMETVKEIRKAIRELKREMTECGIRRVSCFNGGLDMPTYRANARLFELKVKLEQAQKRESENG
jgi:hypothetical protein